MLKEKYLDVRKVVKQVHHITYDRKNRKNTIQEALLSNREKVIDEESIEKTTSSGKNGRRLKKRPKRTKLQILQGTNLGLQPQMPKPKIDMPQLYKEMHFPKVRRIENRRQQESKVNKETEDVEESDTDKSINKITGPKHVTDRRNFITMKKMLEREKNLSWIPD